MTLPHLHPCSRPASRPPRATEVAGAGADGGIDILACRDPLFLHPPVVKVQVKAKPTTKIGPDEVRQLSGLVDGVGERGIFVATGGFTVLRERKPHRH